MFGDSPQEIYINYDNSTHTTLNVSYSDVEGGEADIDAVDGENIIWSDTNIDLRPLLDNDYRPIYTEEVQSSCVDTGDPLMGWDADNTPPDMGAITAERPITDEWILPSVDTDNGWKWMSFPVLDKHSYIEDGAENLVYDGDMAEYMLNWRDLLNTEGSPLDFVKWCIDGVEDKIYTYNDYWENLSHIFTSVQGYKIKMNGNEPFELPVVGFLQDPETEIELNADCENWVGYFLEDSQSPQDAFSDVWRHISMLKTQHWIMVNVGNGYWFSNTKRPVLNYGDMVIVNTNADCSFRWVDIEEVSPFENPAIEHFSYQELSDYAPVVIEGLEDYENIDEIGMFINDECVGAEKVEESPMALKGYVGNKPLTNITFETHPKDTGLGKNAQHEIVNTKYEVMYYERKVHFLHFIGHPKRGKLSIKKGVVNGTKKTTTIYQGL